MRLYFSTTTSGVSQDNNPEAPSANLPAYQNTQVLMRCVPNNSGTSATVTDQFLNEMQCVKRELCIKTSGTPVRVFHKVNQLSELAHTALDSDYAMQPPQFISTGEPGTPHYGVSMHLQRVDDLDFNSGKSNGQYVRIEADYHLEFKQVS